MSFAVLEEAWHTIVPERDNPHGPLPGLLVMLTVVTGLVDAFSYLQLDRVFVANMTGNVVFLAFSLGGAAGFKWWASLLAVFAFSGGAYAGGRVVKNQGHHRGRHLLVAATIQLVFVAASLIVAFVIHQPFGAGAVAALVAMLGVGMGLQNATARSLGVPDLTTTVLTLTLTGISADSGAAGSNGSHIGRRFVSIVSMFGGALAGAALCEGGYAPWALVAAAVLLGLIVARAFGLTNSTESWTTPKK